MMTSAHWDKFDRLRAALEALKATPERFNFLHGSLADPTCDAGCVVAHARWLFSPNRFAVGYEQLVEWLGVTPEEAAALWSPFGNTFIYDHKHNNPLGQDTSYPVSGLIALNEALRRMDVLASRYVRPTISEPALWPSSTDEDAFLAALRLLVTQPLVSLGE